MWQPDIHPVSHDQPRGGVAPSSRDLALNIYVARTNAQRLRTRRMLVPRRIAAAASKLIRGR